MDLSENSFCGGILGSSSEDQAFSILSGETSLAKGKADNSSKDSILECTSEDNSSSLELNKFKNHSKVIKDSTLNRNNQGKLSQSMKKEKKRSIKNWGETSLLESEFQRS